MNVAQPLVARDQILSTLEFRPVVWPLRGSEQYEDMVKRLIRPGAVVKTDKDKVYVVGDVNDMLGTCDCCMAISPTSIVAIAYLWTADNQTGETA